MEQSSPPMLMIAALKTELQSIDKEIDNLSYSLCTTPFDETLKADLVQYKNRYVQIKTLLESLNV